MGQNLHSDIDDLFKEVIEPLYEAPSEPIWKNIEQQLDKDAAFAYKRKLALFKKGNLVLLLLLALLLLKLININALKNNSTIINNTLKNKKTANIKKLTETNYKKRSKMAENRAATLNKQVITIAAVSTSNKNKLITRLAEKNNVVIYAAPKQPSISSATNYRDKANVESSDETKAASNVNNKLLNNKYFSRLNAIILSAYFSKTKLIGAVPVNAVKSSEEDLFLPLIFHQPAKKHNLSLTIFGAPEYADYVLKNNLTKPHDDNHIIEKKEAPDISFFGGFLFTRSLNKKLLLQSGVTYSSSSISIDPTKIYAIKTSTGDVKYKYNTSLGYSYIKTSFSSSPAVGDSLYTRTSVHTLKKISIPLIVKYKVGNKRFSLNAGVGIALNILTNASLETEVEDLGGRETEFTSKLQGLNKLTLSLLLMPDADYQLSKKWNVKLMPCFDISLIPINKHNSVKTYSYHAGIAAGINYNF